MHRFPQPAFRTDRVNKRQIPPGLSGQEGNALLYDSLCLCVSHQNLLVVFQRPFIDIHVRAQVVQRRIEIAQLHVDEAHEHHWVFWHLVHVFFFFIYYKCPFFTLSINVSTQAMPMANAKPNINRECVSISIIFLPYQNCYLTYLFSPAQTNHLLLIASCFL